MIVRNARAGRAPSEGALRAAAAPLRAAGAAIQLRNTERPGHARELAAEAARDALDVVVAAGGDGTVHEVVNGLAGSDTALSVIPAGTANVWAKEARIPRDAARALGWIEGARRVRLDLGRAELGDGSQCYFLLMCSTGLDAEAVRRVEQGRLKRRLGRLWYGLVGLERALRAPAVQTRLSVDGVALERRLLFAVAGNTRLYGGFLRLASDARADDGLLDLAAFSGSGPATRLRLAARALRGGLHERAGDGIDYLRGATIEIKSERPLPVQADGEYLGETPLRLSVAPRALDVLIARGPTPLLAG